MMPQQYDVDVSGYDEIENNLACDASTASALVDETTLEATPNQVIIHREHNINDDCRNNDFHLLSETKLLMNIAVPTIIIQFSMYFLYPQAASVVGRNLGTQQLAGFSLATLTGNMTCLSLLLGTLTATETYMPRAFGERRYRDVGIYAIRGLAACVLVLCPLLIPLLVKTESILRGFGQDIIAARLASQWIKIYLLGVPAVIIFRVCQRFLSAQGVVWPLAWAAAFGCFIVHPVLLRLLVRNQDGSNYNDDENISYNDDERFFKGGRGSGFRGSGWAVVLSQTVQTLVLLLVVKFTTPHVKETWPGLSWDFVKESIRWKAMKEFLRLGFGGVLSFSEWWFWEIMCFTAGRLGIIPLCVHTIAYNLVPIIWMIPLGTSIGVSVRLGSALAEDNSNPYRAKRIACWAMGIIAVLGTVISLLLQFFQRSIVSLFTKDEAVFEGCTKIWHNVAIHNFNLFIFGINGGILRALGYQWHMAGVIFAILWLVTLPLVLNMTIRQGEGIEAMWNIMPYSYGVQNIVLALIYICSDWRKRGEMLHKSMDARRSSISESQDEKLSLPNEETPLLNNSQEG